MSLEIDVVPDLLETVSLNYNDEEYSATQALTLAMADLTQKVLIRGGGGSVQLTISVKPDSEAARDKAGNRTKIKIQAKLKQTDPAPHQTSISMFARNGKLYYNNPDQLPLPGIRYQEHTPEKPTIE